MLYHLQGEKSFTVKTTVTGDNMTREEIIDSLIFQLEETDALNRDYVPVSKQATVEIIRILSGYKEIGHSAQSDKGQTLFYCPDCGKSFWANAREDMNCFDRYHYHTWYASCPCCKKEVSQNDRYWR